MRAKLILLAMLAGLGAWAQSPEDYVVMRAWEHVRRGAVAYQYPTNGLVAYWSMDSRSGDDVTVFDTFGTNDGTAVGTPAFGTDYGKYLEGVDLNGSSQYIDLASKTVIPLGAKTISFWMQTTQVPASYAVLLDNTQINKGNTGIWIIHGLTAGKISYQEMDGDQIFRLTSTTTINDGEWHHIVVTWDGTTSANGANMYINGYLEASATAARSASATASTFDARIGRAASFSTAYYAGSCDEFGVWNRPLTQTEVTDLNNNDEGRFYTP